MEMACLKSNFLCTCSIPKKIYNVIIFYDIDIFLFIITFIYSIIYVIMAF